MFLTISKVFENVTQICTSLNRCVSNKDNAEKIYFEIHESKTQTTCRQTKTNANNVSQQKH